jgi:hypothetical protein
LPTVVEAEKAAFAAAPMPAVIPPVIADMTMVLPIPCQNGMPFDMLFIPFIKTAIIIASKINSPLGSV